MRVAIVGAGIAGLACAAALRSAGHEPTLFEKARGAGGRLSTRRVETKRGPLAIDHGATHFTARSADFSALVRRWEAAGHAVRWPVAGRDAWIGVPSMNAPLKAYGAAQTIHWATPVTALTRSRTAWTVHSEDKRFAPFEAVAVAIPAEQAAPLLSLHDFTMARAAMRIRSHPIWSAFYAFAEPLANATDLIRGSGAIALAVRNSARLGRSPIECWVIQASWEWSETNLTRSADHICEALLVEFANQNDLIVHPPMHSDAQRWLFGQPSGRDPIELWNPTIGLGACGDWLAHGFVEAAWESGHKLGSRIAADTVGAAGSMPRVISSGRPIKNGR